MFGWPMRDALLALRSGKTLDADKLGEAVSLVTESVLRNPDAMLLFSKLWEKGDYLQSHALDCAIYMAAFGYLVFGDVPTAAVWAGAAIVIGSGLYLFARERR